MRLSKFAKKCITINSVAVLLSTAAVPVLQPRLIKTSTVHAASTDDSGVSEWSNWGTVKWGIDSNGTLWIKPQSGTEGTIGDFYGEIAGNIIKKNTIPWFSKAANIKSVRMEGTISDGGGSSMGFLFAGLTNCIDIDISNLKIDTPCSLAAMFANDTNLQKITGLDKFDTSKVTNMRFMFNGCSRLTNLDVSNWDTSNVINMDCMFQNCKALTNLNVSNWDTSKVTDMSFMFNGCSSLTDLNVSNWNTSAVINMGAMFQSCNALTNLDVSNWNTSKVTVISYMFRNCSSLTNLNVSNWDTSTVTDMSVMFYDCSSLTNLDVSNWNTSAVTNIRFMFSACSNLTNLDLSKWNTSAVTDMHSVFDGCSNLTNLNLSKWDTSAVTNMRAMFYNCSNLTNLDLSNWDTSAVTNMGIMFGDCNKLSKLKFGKNFKVPSGQNTGLPDPSKRGEYTGRWSKADGSNGMSASEMMNLTGKEHDIAGKSLNKTLTQEDRAGTWVWERGYTVTLNPNGGSGSAKTFTAVLRQDQVFGKDSASAYITDPGYTKSPATFIGLSEQQDGSGARYQYPFTYETNGNKTLYAQWQEPTYTVKFDANNGSGSMANETITPGSSKSLSKNTFTRKMYDFAGWNTKKDGTGKSYTDQQSVSDIADAGKTITLYAQWKKASWYDSGMSKIDDSDNNKHEPNTYIVTIPTQITKTGLSVGNINESVIYNVNVTGNIPSGNYVHILASTNNKLTGKNGNLELSIKQGKTVWSEAEAYGTINQDGSLSGTTALDTVTISGTAKSVDQYTGLVTYSADLSTSEK